MTISRNEDGKQVFPPQYHSSTIGHNALEVHSTIGSTIANWNHPQSCPTCGRAYDLFDHDTSVLLDWIARLQMDVHHLKRAVEEVLP